MIVGLEYLCTLSQNGFGYMDHVTMAAALELRRQTR